VATEISRLARQVAAEVTDRPVARVVVKVRYAPFDTITHGAPLAPGTQSPPGIPQPYGDPLPLNEPPATPASADTDAADADAAWATIIEQAAAIALAKFTPGRPVRLLGVRAEFADNPA
jgi:DNA polymerase-4